MTAIPLDISYHAFSPGTVSVAASTSELFPTGPEFCSRDEPKQLSNEIVCLLWRGNNQLKSARVSTGTPKEMLVARAIVSDEPSADVDCVAAAAGVGELDPAELLDGEGCATGEV